jgi:hypothetical protein
MTTPESAVQQIVVHQDNSPFPVGITLDESNYPLWSQLMKMRIGARNKTGFITGDSKKLTTAGPELQTWTSENNFKNTYLKLTIWANYIVIFDYFSKL